MGQKSKPKVLRINISDDWESRWTANSKTYSNFIVEDHKIRCFLRKELDRALPSRIKIFRKTNYVNVQVYIGRPGVVFGKNGIDVKLLNEDLSKLISKKVIIDIIEVKNTDLDALILAKLVAVQLEKRIPFRRAMKQALQRALKAGALGVRIACSGRLGGVEIARKEDSMEGSIPLHTLGIPIDYANVVAYTIYGKCGVKVWINKGQEVKQHVSSKKN
ncbi:MAG: 30S ribosomal protein S3 [bacterium]